MWEESYNRLLPRVELLKFFAEYLAGNLCAPVTASLDDFASKGINIGSVENSSRALTRSFFFWGEVNQFVVFSLKRGTHTDCNNELAYGFALI